MKFHIDFYPGVFFFYELEWHKGFQIKVISEALKYSSPTEVAG